MTLKKTGENEEIQLFYDLIVINIISSSSSRWAALKRATYGPLAIVCHAWPSVFKSLLPYRSNEQDSFLAMSLQPFFTY